MSFFLELCLLSQILLKLSSKMYALWNVKKAKLNATRSIYFIEFSGSSHDTHG